MMAPRPPITHNSASWVERPFPASIPRKSEEF